MRVTINIPDDTSRRVAWAKFYEARAEADDLRRVLKRVCKTVLCNSRLRNDDDLIVLVTELLKSL